MVWNVGNWIRWFFSEGVYPGLDLIPFEANQPMNLSAGNLSLFRPQVHRRLRHIEPGCEIFDLQEHRSRQEGGV